MAYHFADRLKTALESLPDESAIEGLIEEARNMELNHDMAEGCLAMIHQVFEQLGYEVLAPAMFYDDIIWELAVNGGKNLKKKTPELTPESLAAILAEGAYGSAVVPAPI